MFKGVWKIRKSGSGTGTGTGTGEINECFKLRSMININTPPPFSTFLARWMMVLGDWVWDDALIILYKTYLLMFVGRDNIGKLVKMWVVRVKTWVCNGCYYTEQRSNEQRTKNTLKKNLKICNYNRFLLDKHRWNTRISPFTKKSYLYRT